MATVTDERGESMTIVFNLFELKQRLQLQLGEELSWSQIAREADLHRNTVERIANNRTERVDLATIAKLLLFFRARGMEVDVGDLIVESSGKLPGAGAT